MKKSELYDNSLSAWISIFIFLSALSVSWIRLYFLWIVILMAFIALGDLLFKLCVKKHIRLFEILGVVFSACLAISLITLPYIAYEFLLLFLFISLMMCLYFCSIEDSKKYAILHAMYIVVYSITLPQGFTI